MPSPRFCVYCGQPARDVACTSHLSLLDLDDHYLIANRAALREWEFFDVLPEEPAEQV